MRIIGGGGQVRICVQSEWHTEGGLGACSPGKFDFEPFIRCNLVESGNVCAQT